MRLQAHHEHRVEEPHRARSAGDRPQRARTASRSGDRTPQADVAGRREDPNGPTVYSEVRKVLLEQNFSDTRVSGVHGKKA